MKPYFKTLVLELFNFKKSAVKTEAEIFPPAGIFYLKEISLKYKRRLKGANLEFLETMACFKFGNRILHKILVYAKPNIN